MSQYNFKIKYCQERSLAHVDYLSRNPISKIVMFRETLNLWEEILPEVEKFKKYHLEAKLWKPVITKVKGKPPQNKKKQRTLTNKVWYTGEHL